MRGLTISEEKDDNTIAYMPMSNGNYRVGFIVCGMPRQFVNITHAEMMDDISKLTSGEKVIVNLLDGYTQSGREQE